MDKKWVAFSSKEVADRKQIDNVLSVSPIPVVDVLNIKLGKQENNTCLVEIFSVDGKLILNEQVQRKGEIGKVDVSRLKKGMYVCRVSNGNFVGSKNFIK